MRELEREVRNEPDPLEGLMWDPEEEEEDQLDQDPLADDSAVSRSTRSHRPELLQGIP